MSRLARLLIVPVLCLVLIASGSAALAAASTPAPATPGLCSPDFDTDGVPARLLDLYLNYDWDDLRSETCELLKFLDLCAPCCCQGKPGTWEGNIYVISLLARDAKNEPTVVRYVYPDVGRDPGFLRLPGLTPDGNRRAFELLVADKPFLFESVFKSTEKKDPVQDDLVAAAKKVAEPLAAALLTHDPTPYGLVETPELPSVGPTSIPFHYSLSAIPLRFDRSTIEVTNRIVPGGDPCFPNDGADLRTRIHVLHNGMSAKAVDYADTLLDALKADDCSAAKKAYAATRSYRLEEYAKQTLTPTDRRAIISVDSLIAASIPKSKAIVSSYELTNIRLRHWSMSLITGGMFDISNRGRAKVAEGNVTPDPLSGAATAVVFNYHPDAFDGERLTISDLERFRLFCGAMLTPDFGLTVGAGYGIVRGFSLNMGWAYMRSQKIRDADAFDSPPNQPHNPLQGGATSAWYFGVGVNLN